MEYLRSQHLRLRAALGDGLTVRDVLPIKWYVQELMTTQIHDLVPARSRVLEVGCGGSLSASMLARRGHEVFALDIDSEMVEFQKTVASALRAKVTVVRASGFRLPFEDGEFGYVFSVGLIEHFNQEEQALLIREMMRVSSNLVHVEIPNQHPLSTFFVVGRESDEEHLVCHPGQLLVAEGARPVSVSGRCVVSFADQVAMNPELCAFLNEAAPGLVKQVYAATDIDPLISFEESLPSEQRLLYGFQIAWIYSVRRDSAEVMRIER